MSTKEWFVQNQRMLRMERLYILDQRHLPTHPKHGLFIGLAEKAEELEKVLDEKGSD